LAPPCRRCVPDPELFDSSDRVWHAARLFHRGLAPRIIVSGGSFLVATGQAPPTQTEALAMRQFLVALGVPESAIVMEGKSLNTIENMQETPRPGGHGTHRPGHLGLSHAAGASSGAQGRPGGGRFSDGLAGIADSEPVVGIVDAVGRGAGRFGHCNPEYLAWAFDYRSVAVKS